MSNLRIIYTRSDDGGISIIVPTVNTSIEEAVKAVPTGTPYEVISSDNIPSDRTFRNAWELNGYAVAPNLEKCKGIAHDKRRAARSVEFAPLDVQATIPSEASKAETSRQQIRDKYSTMQTDIDQAASLEQLKTGLIGIL